MKLRLVAFTCLSAVSCFAGQSEIRITLESALTSKPDTQASTYHDFISKVNEVSVGALRPDDIKTLLPLADRCLSSGRADIQRKGLLFVMAISMRPDSTSLLDPVIPDLERLGADPSSALRLGALYVLGSTNPAASPAAVDYLKRQLEDPSHSAAEQRTIAASLVQASPANPNLLPAVLQFANQNPNATVKVGILAQLRTSRIFNPAASKYIAASLGNADPDVRHEALRSVEKLDPAQRISFVDQLLKIADGPEESQENRTLANSLVSK